VGVISVGGETWIEVVMVGFALLYALGSKSDDSSRHTCRVWDMWVIPCENPGGFSGEKSRAPCDEM
jgi:hypothetical protein